MTIVAIQEMFGPLEIDLRPLSALTEQDFVALCAANPELRLERTAEGDIVIMTPEGGTSGRGNTVLQTALENWATGDGTGLVFGSSTGFRLPNGATRSPDVAWVRLSRLAALTPAQKRGFLPLCPDFVMELRSPTDRLPVLQAKMDEYLANGAQLGWLIDPETQTVWVYRPGQPTDQLDGPLTVDGSPELPGLVAALGQVWEPGF
jgi:Uma2 family endonuclease